MCCSWEGSGVNQEIGEVCVSFCAACGTRLRWEQRVGEAFACWIGHCECGWLRVLHLQTVVEEAGS